MCHSHSFTGLKPGEDEIDGASTTLKPGKNEMTSAGLNSPSVNEVADVAFRFVFPDLFC